MEQAKLEQYAVDACKSLNLPEQGVAFIRILQRIQKVVVEAEAEREKATRTAALEAINNLETVYTHRDANGPFECVRRGAVVAAIENLDVEAKAK